MLPVWVCSCVTLANWFRSSSASSYTVQCNVFTVWSNVYIVGKNTVYSIPEIMFWKIRNEFLIYHTWNNGISEKIWKISNVYRPKTPPTTPRSLFWHIDCAVPKWKILNMVLDVYKSHDISLHLNWKDVSTVLWSCSGTGVRELSKFKWAFTNFFKLAQTKRPSKWQLEWILGRLGPGQLGPVHFVKIHKWQFLWNIKLADLGPAVCFFRWTAKL